MKAGIIIATTLALATVGHAQAATHRVHHQVNPMVRGLGQGLIYMLRSVHPELRGPVQPATGGPSGMPVYSYRQERPVQGRPVGSGLPNLIEVPPRGWPFKPFPKGSQRRSYRAVASGLSAPCQQARRLGGPCGCFASELVFGHSVRPLWLANNWSRFPRGAPAPGMVAWWPGRHVAVVEAVNGDRVTVHDSWAIHEVSARGLIFVDPRGGEQVATTPSRPVLRRRGYAGI